MIVDITATLEYFKKNYRNIETVSYCFNVDGETFDIQVDGFDPDTHKPIRQTIRMRTLLLLSAMLPQVMLFDILTKELDYDVWNKRPEVER